LYRLCDVNNASRLNVLLCLNDFISPDDGSSVHSGDSRDLDCSDGSVGDCDEAGLDVILEVGGDDNTFDLAFDLSDHSPDTLLCSHLGLCVNLRSDHNLLGHGGLGPRYELLSGVDLCSGHGDKLGVKTGLELRVHLCSCDHNLLSWHSLGLSANNSTNVGAGNENCLSGKLSCLDHSPGDELGLDSGLTWNSSDHSAGNHTVLEVG